MVRNFKCSKLYSSQQDVFSDHILSQRERNNNLNKLNKEIITLSYLSVVEALAKQDNLRNEARVGYHHGDGSEHTLQVVRKFRTTCVPGVHCDEDTTRPHLRGVYLRY